MWWPRQGGAAGVLVHSSWLVWQRHMRPATVICALGISTSYPALGVNSCGDWIRAPPVAEHSHAKRLPSTSAVLAVGDTGVIHGYWSQQGGLVRPASTCLIKTVWKVTRLE
ncbi:hypothetical protein E2C01_069968 [Portunus trituberculatus]|uniref:Uncharacterized protein n=1 Tax=Portunus trituberculatus TaxID=210409 RepID=A0A5B7I3W3_PORTR|nr:hypothetical protein [Portunus trituberculatus]